MEPTVTAHCSDNIHTLTKTGNKHGKARFLTKSYPQSKICRQNPDATNLTPNPQLHAPSPAHRARNPFNAIHPIPAKVQGQIGFSTKSPLMRSIPSSPKSRAKSIFRQNIIYWASTLGNTLTRKTSMKHQSLLNCPQLFQLSDQTRDS